ncbi:non-homologous end joining protein Ku [Amnibacterium setariae]|jgi:DNA end-binding protein Ku|uniref:Non-homologous end joining protein Ku n=1 Tax=Amnibacterium setariae TaxID=2306585 RepID=A0A3A1U2T3_9MICO|nr:Ku protein [Amnibacterium setariae]RIX31164.1 Ku protein [Amnibacterium setariae]
MRSIWRGAITFGLVNVPVKLYSATEDHDLPMHQVHNADGGRIRYQRRCEVCGRVVEFQDIDKAYDAGDRTVVLTAEDLKSLPSEKSREIDVVEFVPAAQVDAIRLDRSYYLEPDAKSPRSYMLMRKVLEDTERVAIVQFTLRQKTRLGVLRVHGKVLLLQSLLWDDEVREASFPSLDADVRIQKREVDMATSLVKSFESDFSPADFTDEYQEQLKKLVDAKLEQGESVDTAATFGEQEEDEGDGEVIDLMEALKRSVEANRAKAKSSSASSGDGGGRKRA